MYFAAKAPAESNSRLKEDGCYGSHTGERGRKFGAAQTADRAISEMRPDFISAACTLRVLRDGARNDGVFLYLKETT